MTPPRLALILTAALVAFGLLLFAAVGWIKLS